MPEYDYKALLKKAYEKLPEISKDYSRFEIPNVASKIQGKTTVVHNLGDLSKIVNRSADMLAKYLIREFGTSGSHDGQHLVMKGQFKQFQVQGKFEEFLKQFVLCPECGKPDTKILHEKRINLLQCEACGSRHPIGGMRAPQIIEKKPSIGEELILQITQTGKKGDGVARIGEYVVFVTNTREGQRVKARITGLQGKTIFAQAVEILR